MQRILKEGDHAFIFKATRVKNGEEVAIKQLKNNFYGWDEVINLREIDTLKRINHPNVVKLIEVVKTMEKVSLVFELMENNLNGYY